jgi:hypothetical protein
MINSSPSPFFDVRMRGFPTRTEAHDAVELIQKRVGLLGTETVELESAPGRVLATAVTDGRPLTWQMAALHASWSNTPCRITTFATFSRLPTRGSLDPVAGIDQ